MLACVQNQTFKSCNGPVTVNGVHLIVSPHVALCSGIAATDTDTEILFVLSRLLCQQKKFSQACADA